MSAPGSTTHDLEGDDKHWKPTTCNCFSCGKLATGLRKCPNFICRQSAVQKGQTDAGKSTIRLCQDRVSQSFIIPAPYKVCQIVWTRRLKDRCSNIIENLFYVGDYLSGCLCHFFIFGSCILCFLHTQVIFIPSSLNPSLMGLSIRKS